MLLSFLLAAAPATIDLTNEAARQGLIPSGAGTPASMFGRFLSTVLQGLMAIALLAALISLIWGGIDWISSNGEKGKIEAARNKITGAVVGVIVFASTLAIYMLVQKFLGVQILQFNG